MKLVWQQKENKKEKESRVLIVTSLGYPVKANKFKKKNIFSTKLANAYKSNKIKNEKENFFEWTNAEQIVRSLRFPPFNHPFFFFFIYFILFFYFYLFFSFLLSIILFFLFFFLFYPCIRNSVNAWNAWCPGRDVGSRITPLCWRVKAQWKEKWGNKNTGEGGGGLNFIGSLQGLLRIRLFFPPPPPQKLWRGKNLLQILNSNCFIRLYCFVRVSNLKFCFFNFV